LVYDIWDKVLDEDISLPEELKDVSVAIPGNKLVPYGREALSIALSQLRDRYSTQPMLR